jgi:hypothetical protein
MVSSSNEIKEYLVPNFKKKKKKKKWFDLKGWPMGMASTSPWVGFGHPMSQMRWWRWPATPYCKNGVAGYPIFFILFYSLKKKLNNILLFF